MKTSELARLSFARDTGIAYVLLTVAAGRSVAHAPRALRSLGSSKGVFNA